ncbi:MAG TPA: malonyl-CoA synthase, partial [Paracoccus solventivorans]|uniref:AMP-binding protein n=1 Tax=Paracoccus solventivorans TaxID=53463 RepID=UPI002C63D86A
MTNPLYDALIAPQIDRAAPLLLTDGAEISGAGFAAMAHRFAHALVVLGLEPGDRMAVQIQKSPAALALYGAALAAGGEL